MPVTTISKRLCQRERSRPVESLRVMSFEPTANTNISAHVNTMVPFNLNNPYCQKIISSGLIPRPIKTDSPVNFPKRRGSDSVMLKEIRHGGTCIVARRFRWVEASRLGKVGEGGERY